MILKRLDGPASYIATNPGTSNGPNVSLTLSGLRTSKSDRSDSDNRREIHSDFARIENKVKSAIHSYTFCVIKFIS